MEMVAPSPPMQISAQSFGGFGMGSSNMMKPLDPKVFQTLREYKNNVM